MLESNRFGFEPEVTAKISRMKDVVIYEVPISYNGRTYDEGKKITWKDGAAALWHIWKHNMMMHPKKTYRQDSSNLDTLVRNKRRKK